MRWGAALAALAALPGAGARSILDFPTGTRQRNVVQLTRESCEECVPLEDFYKSNHHAFVLFYERALAGKHHYKQAIVTGFHAACADLRYSHIVCGVVDMVNDKEYAMRYIDPKTAPAHIAVREGQPLGMTKHHIEQLMAKPGDKDTILWHLRDVFAGDPSPDILAITAAARTAAAFDGALARHEVVIVGAPEAGGADAFRAAAQRLVLSGELPMPALPMPRKRKSQAKREPGSLGFLLASGAKLLGAKGLGRGSVAAFVNGTRVAEATMAASAEDSALEAIRAAAPPSLLSARPAPGAGAGGEPPAKARRRRRRRRAQPGGAEL